MSILTMVQGVMAEQGLARPSVLFSSTDPTALRLQEIAKRNGEALYRAHDWSMLHREYEFTTSDGFDNYAVPGDWGRPVAMTAWDRTTFRRMRGNLSSQQWQRLRSGLSATPGLSFTYRLVVGPLAGSILLDPVPTGANELVIEYVSKYWSETSAGSGQAVLLADTDEIRLSHELYSLGLTWRVRRSFGMPFADERADYEAAVKTSVGNDLNLPIISFGPSRKLPFPNLPEGSWNV